MARRLVLQGKYVMAIVVPEKLSNNTKLRVNINWNKDRGKDVASAPWYHVFDGNRINDHHLTLAEKRKAREAVE